MSSFAPRWRSLVVLLTALSIPCVIRGQANGRLQIHQLNVGQGDATLIVSPLGQTMLIDSGPTSASACASAAGIITYLTNLGLQQLDYHVASHYHADHIGCTDQIVARWPVQIAAYDRGLADLPTTQIYTTYANAIAAKRQAVSLGQAIVLDASSPNPVTLTVVAVNANGGSGAIDENDRSVVLKLRFGQFDALFGGDLRGELGSVVHNVEQRIAADVGQVELYKVHHHGSATSSSAAFMSFIRPKVAMMSMSATNAFGHPTAAALHNIHTENTTVYWTTAGNGAAPGPLDVVANGAIITEVNHGGLTFTVRANAASTQYSGWPSDDVPPGRKVNSDFNGDGRSDVGIFRPSVLPDALWYSTSSGGGAFQIYFGTAGDIPAPADYDGDRMVDAVIWRPSTGLWYGPRTGAAAIVTQLLLGQNGDVPVPCDYDGNGAVDPAVYRPSTGLWFGTTASGATVVLNTNLGTGSGLIPVPADYNGDGRCDPGIMIPAIGPGGTNLWYSVPSGGGTVFQIYFGAAGDVPAPGDYDGDGLADAVIFRPSTGLWYGPRTGAAQIVTQIVLGQNGDIPVPGDYDGNGAIDPAIYRPSTGLFFGTNAAGNTLVLNTNLGVAAGDIPTGHRPQYPAPSPSPAPPPNPLPPPEPAPPPALSCGAPAVVTCINGGHLGTPTARCADGVWSCSTTGPGTCSGHGGIACRVCPGPLCR